MEISVLRRPLVGVRAHEPELERYLRLADAGVFRITAILKNAHQTDENKRVHVVAPLEGTAEQLKI